MAGNYIDLLIIFYLILSLLGGVRRKNSELLLTFISVCLALALSFVTYRFTAQFIAANFQLDDAYANVIGFFLNTFLFKISLNLLFTRLFEKSGISLNFPDLYLRRFAAGFLALSYGFLTVFLMMSILAALTLPGIMTAQIEKSKFGSFVKSDPIGANDRFKEIFSGMITAALKDFSFMDIKTGSDEKIDLGFQALEVTVDAEAEDKMFAMVNEERTARGLKQLTMNEEARRAARDYGQYLFKNGIFSHIDLEGKGPGDRMKNYNVTFMMAGENLAYAPGLEEAHKGLMESKGHRENILHPFFGRVGIGVIDGGSYGKIFVQEFLD